MPFTVTLEEFEKFFEASHIQRVLSNNSFDFVPTMAAAEQLKKAQDELENQARKIQELEAKLAQAQINTAPAGIHGDLPNSSNSNSSENTNTVVLQALTQLLRNTGNQNNHGQQVLYSNPDVVREFRGGVASENAREWLRELENTKTLYQWTDAVTLSVAKSRFKDGAYLWILTNAEKLDTFDFKDEFKASFMGTRSTTNRLQTMLARVRKSDESLEDYFFLIKCDCVNL